MRAILSVAIVLIVALGVVGYQRGWFRFVAEKTEGGTEFGVKVDNRKIAEDREKVGEVIGGKHPAPAKNEP